MKSSGEKLCWMIVTLVQPEVKLNLKTNLTRTRLAWQGKFQVRLTWKDIYDNDAESLKSVRQLLIEINWNKNEVLRPFHTINHMWHHHTNHRQVITNISFLFFIHGCLVSICLHIDPQRDQWEPELASENLPLLFSCRQCRDNALLCIAADKQPIKSL